jgi:ABC-type nitrate/sulfonate/bicarbonate transport system substrate-binding protein
MTIDLLRKNGVDPNSVTFIVSRGGTQERLKMLLGGVIDAANLNPPNNFIAERAGFRTLFAYGDYFELAQNGLVVNEAMLRERRLFLKRVVRAFLNSHLYMLEHNDETVKWMVNKLNIETRDAEKTFNLIVKAVTPYGVATPKAVQNSLSDQALNSAKSDLVDYGVLQEVLTERGMKTD